MKSIRKIISVKKKYHMHANQFSGFCVTHIQTGSCFETD